MVSRKQAGDSRGASGAYLPALVALGLLLVSAGGSAQERPYPIFSVDHLDAVMKTLGPNVAGVRAALVEADYPTAKQRAIRSREQLATTVTFWRDRERDDALEWLRSALSRLDALDTALSVDEKDPAVLGSITAELTEYCVACHTAYRERDQNGDYQLRVSALP